MSAISGLQKDSAYIHQCDHFLPAMVALAHETGPEERRNPLRAAGLAGIGEMVSPLLVSFPYPQIEPENKGHAG
jgi:hypothetical protein